MGRWKLSGRGAGRGGTVAEHPPLQPDSRSQPWDSSAREAGKERDAGGVRAPPGPGGRAASAPRAGGPSAPGTAPGPRGQPPTTEARAGQRRALPDLLGRAPPRLRARPAPGLGWSRARCSQGACPGVRSRGRSRSWQGAPAGRTLAPRRPPGPAQRPPRPADPRPRRGLWPGHEPPVLAFSSLRFAASDGSPTAPSRAPKSSLPPGQLRSHGLR